MHGYVFDDATAEEVEAEKATYGPVADALRALIPASIRTSVSPEVAAEAAARLREVEAMLSAEGGAPSYGMKYSSAGIARPWGNTVVGVRNPVAPPLEIEREGGTVWSEFHLGPQFEGPPRLVHGGVSAMVLDQLLGEAAASGGKPGMTGTLTVRYRRATPLGDLRGDAHVDRVEGHKTFAVGTISDAEGVCVEAEGVFITPRWARDLVDQEQPSRYE